MDIENVWQQSSGNDDALNKMLQQNDFNNVHSKLPLGKLKRNLLIGIVWATLITAFYIALFFFINIWQVYVALGTLILFNVWIAIDSFKLYKSINETISAKNSLKEELQKNYTGFQKWWTLQQRASLFVYPIALTGGFILGGVLGSNKPVENFLYNPKMLSILGITMLIVIPLCYFGAKGMFNYAYGKHLKKLKATIDELSEAHGD
jgi:hypothetical protein